METEKVQTPVQTEWQLREQIEAEIRAKLRPEYEGLLLMWKQTALEDVKKDAEKVAQEGLQKLFDEYKASQKPPTQQDIQLLLSQEYSSFSIKVNLYEDSSKTEEFIIRELPQKAEREFYRQFKDKVLKSSGALKAFQQANMDATFEERAKNFLDLFDEGFDVLAEAVVICLNPFKKRSDITKEWVQENVSSSRQWNIIEAQMMVNRLKDFFSKLSSSGQSTQMMLEGVSFQQLQQRARS